MYYNTRNLGAVDQNIYDVMQVPEDVRKQLDAEREERERLVAVKERTAQRKTALQAQREEAERRKAERLTKKEEYRERSKLSAEVPSIQKSKEPSWWERIFGPVIETGVPAAGVWAMSKMGKDKTTGQQYRPQSETDWTTIALVGGGVAAVIALVVFMSSRKS